MADFLTPWSHSPHADLVVAAVILAFAVGSGWLAALLTRRIIAPWLSGRVPHFAAGFAPRIPVLARWAIVALVIAASMGVPGLEVTARLALAIGLGIAVGLLAYQIGRAIGWDVGAATGMALLTIVLVTTGRLGGLEPLTTGLDRAGLGIGRYRLSLLDVVTAAGLGLLLFLAARTLIRLISRSIGRAGGLDSAQRVLFQKLAQIAVVTVAVFLGIDLLGIDLTALAVFSGAFGLAIGFGLQKTFGNLISGLILLLDRSVKPGDVIAVGDTFGWVNKIGVRAVSILTRDGKEHLIPNETLMTEEVENWSYSSRDVRVHVGFSVSYECDLRLVQRLATEAAASTPRVLAKPPPVCWIKAFGDNGVEFDLRIWIDDPEAGVGNIMSEVFLRIWDAFKEHKVSMPFPQRDLRIRSLPEGWPGGPA